MAEVLAGVLLPAIGWVVGLGMGHHLTVAAPVALVMVPTSRCRRRGGLVFVPRVVSCTPSRGGYRAGSARYRLGSLWLGSLRLGSLWLVKISR
jgi:hypothetical protein